MSSRPPGPETVSVEALLAGSIAFDDILDARTPAEFEADHLPGAISTPVLSDHERVIIGTRYTTDSFEAKREGAARIARNIASLLETTLADRPRDWSPVVYCWRGGSRSGALAIVLTQIGWRVKVIGGGYKAFRQHILSSLSGLVAERRFRVVCGVTGCGKTRFLHALSERGAAVLDLEAIATHRGSLLGAVPDRAQPSQRLFESRLWAALQALPTDEDIYVESESRKIGNVQIPQVLMEKMRASECLSLSLPTQDRVTLLCEEYAHFLREPARLELQIEKLRPLIGDEQTRCWLDQIERQDWRALVEGLLDQHYDPSYTRSIGRNYPGQATARVVVLGGPAPSDYDSAASILLEKRSTL